jgi:hypothetical protein
LASSENFQKLPKENNRPKGENSPNLVTLMCNANAVAKQKKIKNKK